MKGVKIFLGLFYLTIGVCYGQSYESILKDDTTRWNVFLDIVDAPHNYAYYTYSEVELNKKKYFEIFREEISSADSELGKNSILWSYLREDTITGEYWIVFPDDINIEYPYMNMSLTKGESFDFYFGSDIFFTTEEVDSVFIKDGLKHIAFFDHGQDPCNYDTVFFIEGVGSTLGFMASFEWGLKVEYPLCAYKDGVQVQEYGFCYGSSCFVEIAGVGLFSSDSKFNIDIFPNPSEGTYHIHNNNDEIGLSDDIEIRTAYGDLVFVGSYVNAPVLEPGFYIISVAGQSLSLIVL